MVDILEFLRKKIEEDDKNPKLIETIRGVGYRFNPNIDRKEVKNSRRLVKKLNK